MKKAADVKEFVERIDALKKQNPKDLSSDQDLSIAIMNLISIEEHLVFSGAKTGKTGYYDLVGEIRELRKDLMQQMIKEYFAPLWKMNFLIWLPLWKVRRSLMEKRNIIHYLT